MPAPLIDFLGSQPLMQVVRGLFYAPEPRHLRALAHECKLSPSGVSDILRRLSEAGLLKETRRGNRRCFVLRYSDTERAAIAAFLKAYELAFVESRARALEKRAPERLRWMNEAATFFRAVKRRRRDTP